MATAPHWIDSGNPLLVAVASARWVVGLTAVAVLVAALSTRLPRPVLLAGALVCVHVGLAGPAYRGEPAPAAPGHELTVLAANILYGRGDLTVVHRLAAQTRADVVVVLEASEDLDPRLESSGLTRDYPYRAGVGRADAGGSLVLSRWPLTELDGSPPTVFGQPLVQVSTPDGPLTLRAVHSASPLLPEWRGELDWLEETSDRQPGPLLLAGDFNASRDHTGFRRLLAGAGLRDAHEAAGAGWVRTWDTLGFPHVQIDHVLTRHLPVTAAGQARIPGSDHAAVWARVDTSGLAGSR